jgi:hypothetical protein
VQLLVVLNPVVHHLHLSGAGHIIQHEIQFQKLFNMKELVGLKTHWKHGNSEELM